MSLIELPQNPEGILEVILGDWQKAPLPPGFGHTWSALAGIISYCQIHNLYPVLNDDSWCYGKWLDFFEPFWDEAQLQKVLNSGLSKRVIDTNLRETNYGFSLSEIEPRVVFQRWRIYRAMYKLCPSMVKIIEDKTANIPPIDVAVHFRLAYEHGCNSLDWFYNDMRRTIEVQNLPYDNIFVLADKYETIPYLREKLPDKKIFTLCPENFDGVATNIRDEEGLRLLLSEVEVARKAKHFIGCCSGYSAVTHFIQIHRNEMLVD